MGSEMCIRDRDRMMLPMQQDERTLATMSTTELIKHQGEITMKDVVLEPQEILALYASKNQQEKGETVMLGKIESQNQTIFLIVETTCPLSKTDRPDTGTAIGGVEPPLLLDMNDVDSETEEDPFLEMEQDEYDQTEVPEWLRNELQDAGAMDGARPSTRGGKPDKNMKQQQQQHPPLPHQPISKDKQEYKQKLEKDFHRKQIEIRMEAQNAVREREKALNEEVVRLRQELVRQRQEKDDILTAKSSVASRAETHKGGGVGGGDSASATCVIQ